MKVFLECNIGNNVECESRRTAKERKGEIRRIQHAVFSQPLNTNRWINPNNFMNNLKKLDHFPFRSCLLNLKLKKSNSNSSYLARTIPRFSALFSVRPITVTVPFLRSALILRVRFWAAARRELHNGARSNTFSNYNSSSDRMCRMNPKGVELYDSVTMSRQLKNKPLPQF